MYERRLGMLSIGQVDYAKKKREKHADRNIL